ncbi:MAG: AAA family ATPase [Candidatus Atabeyarchaeum deiterrae]
MRISSGSPIDNLLDGGVQTGLLTHVYGCAGCGKTTFALQLSITACSLGYDVLYFDTEQMFPASRLRQILDGRDPAFMQRIAVAQPLSFEEQHDQFLTLHNSGGRSWSMTNLGLIIVDTIAKHYRIEVALSPFTKVFRRFAEEQIPALLKIARKFDIAILLLNQVTADPSDPQISKPVGGDAVSRAAKYELKLEILDTMKHIGLATITKSPLIRQIGSSAEYAITHLGITQTASV